MIKTTDLHKTYWDLKRGEIQAVLPTNISVEKGEIFGLLGPNGAGKTTFLRMIATVLTPTGGTAVINGFDLLTKSEDVRKSIGFLSGNTKLYGRLSPKELLKYFGELYDMDKKKIKERFEEVIELLDMKDFIEQPIEKLSTGQTQRTSIARCIFHDPELYILDEPTLGLDIMTSRTIIEFIKNEGKKGKAIIFSTHYMQEAENLCNRIGLIHCGKVFDIDTVEGYTNRFGSTNLSDIFFESMKNQEEKIGEN